jgi:hypothetical protein
MLGSCPRRVPRPSFRPGWRIAASVYTVAGVACVLGSAVVPESDAGMLVAIAGGLPWSLGLLDARPLARRGEHRAAVLAGGWAVNAGLLWWLALRPRDAGFQRGDKVPNGAAKRTR